MKTNRLFVNKSPAEQYRDLYRNYKRIYTFSEDCLTWYLGFDITKVSTEYKVAEVIIKEGVVQQVRKLRENPYIRTTDISFGDF